MAVTAISPLQRFGSDRMGHGGQVRALAWARGAPRLASIGADNMIRVWNVETGRQTSAVPMPFGVGRGFLRFWDDDTLLLFDRNEFATVRVDGSQLRAVPAPDLAPGDNWWQEDVVASEDGRVVALLERYRDYRGPATPEAERVRVVEMPSGRVRHVLAIPVDAVGALPPGVPASGVGAAVSALAVSPDGRRLAAIFSLRVLRKRDARAVSDPEGCYLVAWGLREGALRFVTSVDADDANFVSGSHNLRYSPDGRRLLTSWGRARVFDADTGDALRTLDVPVDVARPDLSTAAGDWADGGRAVVCATPERLLAWDAETGELRASRPLDKRALVLDVRASDAHRAVAVVDNAALLSFTLPGLEARHTATGHVNAVHSVAISNRSKRALSSDGDSLKAWDLSTGACLWTKHGSAGFALQMSPDGSQCYAVVAYHPHVIDVNTGKVLSSGDEPLEAVCWRDDGRLIHLGYREEHDGASLMVGEGSDAYIVDRIRSEYLRCVPVLSSNGRRALLWEDAHAFGWDVERRVQLWKRPLELSAAALSHDGRHAAVAVVGARAVDVLDHETGENVATIETGASEYQRCLQWSPVDHRLVYGLDGGRLALVEVDVAALAPGRVVELHPTPVVLQTGRASAVESVSFSRDGTHLVAGTADGSVYAWVVPPRRAS